jgi:hypothetical protein
MTNKGALRVYVARVMYDDQLTHNLVLLVEGQRINVYYPASLVDKLTLFRILRDGLGNREGPRLKTLGESRGCRNWFQFRVKDGDSRQVLPVAKPLNHTLEFFKRTLIEARFHISDEALPKNLCPALQLVPQALLLSSDLVVGGE